ncbi:LamG domain-containing protein [Actinomadura rupiterrae]|uniref:LamG domain-containing protein n=1 Tax=Actinomadura rupiterrae TaxID=559627 RepID=UPI0020A38FD8|nr:LamG domain-containing protein [Actinomadura rupiterrae]MCP2337365.1 hypothetical protein [Actinomadura rupiterrae]
MTPSQFGPTTINFAAVDAMGNRADAGIATFNVGDVFCPAGADGTVPDLCPQRAAGFWRMADGNATTSADLSGKNHPLVLGEGTAAAPGRFGDTDAIGFSTGCGTTQTTVTNCKGSDDSTGRAPVVSTDQSFTVTAWVRLPSLPDRNMTIVSETGDNTTGFSLRYVVDQGQKYWSFEMANPDEKKTGFQVRQARSSLDLPPTDAWTHLAGVYDATEDQLYLYINARPGPDDQRTGPGPINLSAGWTAGSLQIGRSRWPGPFAGNDLAGLVSDVHLYPSAFNGTSAGLVKVDQAGTDGHL